MKKAIQFIDALGNTIQLITLINTIRQVENKPCWYVESRKLFPTGTNWDCFTPLENQYFETDEDAQDAIKKYLLDYTEKSKKLGKDIQWEEVVYAI